MANAAANPYVGPRTFTYVERERFFGREREARDLLSLVIAERLVLFYAQSGAGKSSLLNTRLIPQLKEAGYAVLPMVRVGGELPEGVSDVDNIFIFNCLLHLDQRSGDPRRFAHMTLKDFLPRLTSPDGETYYYDDNAEPAEDVDAYEEPLHVLLIDQFEEIVTAHLERWQEREAFFRQLEEAMAADPLLWVVLTLREDYVAALDPYAGLLSNRLRARFYMQRMGYEAALEAVRRPAQQYGRPFAPGVAETLVDNLRQIRVRDTPATGPGQFVEPVQLQVVCYQLWENLKNREAGAITAQDLLEAGDVDTALASFYEEALASVLHDRRVRGVTELAVRQWFDQYLITEAGTRGMVYRGETHTAELPNLVVQLLEDRYVLRSEIRSGGIWYELIHDRFVEPIARANRAWWDKQSPLMRDAQAWQEANHDKGKLYLGAKLQEALASAAQGEPEPVVAAFLAASAAEQHELDAKEAARQRELEQAQALAEAQQRRAEEQARVAGRLRRLLVALVVVSLLVVGVGIYAWVTRAQAVAEQRRAEQQTRLSFSRELAAAAINNLDTDPERSVLLALHAASVTYSVNKSVTPEAEDALHRAVQASRVRLTLTGHTMRSLAWPSALMARAWPRPAVIRRPRCGTSRPGGSCSPCPATPIRSLAWPSARRDAPGHGQL